MTSVQAAWLAGLIDGEGCIFIQKGITRSKAATPCYALKIKVAMTCETTVRNIHDITGRGTVVSKDRTSSKRNENVVFVWTTVSSDAESLIMDIVPYLVVKREEANIALEFANLPKHKALSGPTPQAITDAREEAYLRLKAAKPVNQRVIED